MFLTLFGGLALFLYGMQAMADGLQKAAGDRMRRILEVLTGIPLIGVVVGAFVTAIIQSSSATTVMVVGFVNAGLMTLKQAVGVIMGANIGTTITAQIIAFKITQFIFPLIALGFGINFLGKSRATKYLGQVLLGFGILFLGMDTMSQAMRPLSENQTFIAMMQDFGHRPLLGLLVGLGATAILQSSSATTGIMIALASANLLSIEAALPMLLGTNIGTCITAVLASIGTSLTAKRAALAHVLFNVIGSVIFLLFLEQFRLAVDLLPGDMARQIANAHTLFNVANTLLFLPLINLFVSFVIKLAPGKEEIIIKGPVYLDERMLGTPAIALSLATKELVRMANLAHQMVVEAMEAFLQKDERKVEWVYEHEDLVDELADQITAYLAKLSQGEMNPVLSKKHTGLLHSVTDIERIGDHAENIAEMALARIQENLPFSDLALEEINALSSLVRETYLQAINCLQHDSVEEAKKTLALEKRIDTLEKELRRNHISRLNTGKCFPGSGVVYLDIVSNLERIGDHSNNIGQIILGEH
ncbi:MAG: Na/Pi cotransporter family protein [Clostridia bacterium]|nr:Na/Pi cotransporter family protein [Clostridia bacterium]